MTAQTPAGPSVSETTSELRSGITPDREHVVAVAIHLAIEGDPSMLQRLEREAKTSSVTPTTSPPAGNIEALRALDAKIERAWAAYRTAPYDVSQAAHDAWIVAKDAFDEASITYVRTHVLPAQTTTAAASGSEGGVEDELRAVLGQPACWVIPGSSTADVYGSIDALYCQYGEFSRPLWSIESISAALARRSAPATGGAARLDREAVADLRSTIEAIRFSPDEKAAFGVAIETFGADAPYRNGWQHACDAILVELSALDPAPQSHAASEGVREAFREGWYINATPACGTPAAEWSDGCQPAEYLAGCEETDWKESKAFAAITLAGRGADAGGWRPIETAAAQDVLAERQRQVEAENWTPEHDDTHAKGELAIAAACYATAPPAICAEREWMFPDRPKSWPWHPSWWKPNFYRRNLVKAGALILAEIERLDRAAAPTAQGEA